MSDYVRLDGKDFQSTRVGSRVELKALVDAETAAGEYQDNTSAISKANFYRAVAEKAIIDGTEAPGTAGDTATAGFAAEMKFVRDDGVEVYRYIPAPDVTIFDGEGKVDPADSRVLAWFTWMQDNTADEGHTIEFASGKKVTRETAAEAIRGATGAVREGYLQAEWWQQDVTGLMEG